ncbi:tRNA ligase NDAI_0G05550 [Naumovozyma dairenensis CBS 421]|uniref:tRNA ligase n=1 Tax=Naumovozyma dairenensis (strain ATCC 10597 / BCRC 20456 / CBS 421 / NBRC 0211 / NRRL Y-12639) TaxID=1071378 RepID=J7SB45_NAUDC|nr:hypothetical protein NDAI_0G05550 [Naumovozyma dairenensis CBS 421]CCK73538.1 hypothetical protein NDAI_0G05550 [Naumovozyma dairenensis CBS 421]
MELENTRDVTALVDALEKSTELSKTRGRAIKRVCQLSSTDPRQIVSWKFNEWDYGKNNITLPCKARGLFILQDDSSSPYPVIVARGYDKFFNINEMSFTRWDWIEENTMGPYEVTIKANGCIIFISGLEDGSLVVCSKHSVGPRDDTDRNHAEAGEKFLLRQLKERGVSSKELATHLYRENLTAVAEYCDDSFEEHILEYKNDKAGLYLHGLNLNQPTFKTLDMDRVSEFSRKYGFKEIECFIKNDVTSLRKFLEDCATRGSFNGEELEGFVIRSKLGITGETFFFKFKFEEPYLMYRQWREVTKDYITSKSRIFKFRKHKFITNKYLDFVIPLLAKDSKLCEEYLKGFHIIELRNLFLKSYGMTGMEILNHSRLKELELKNSIDYERVDERTKFLIFPISVIGCGKTTVANTLTNLFPNSWGHIQNDDIKGKDKAKLIKNSLELLSHPDMKCVFVDRNNHQIRERKQLFEWVEEFKEDYLSYDTNIKIIGLSFVSYDAFDEIKTLTVDRVLDRGNNHQTIKIDKLGKPKVIGIMSGFWKRFQPVDESKSPDNLFDLVINLNINGKDSSLANSKLILEEIHKTFPVLIPYIPDDKIIEESFQKSLSVKLPVREELHVNNRPDNNLKEKKERLLPVYFSADINVDDMNRVKEEIKKVVELHSNEISGEFKLSIDKLFNENKFQNDFHVTLCHVAQSKRGSAKDQEIWKNYKKHYTKLLKKYANDEEIDKATLKSIKSDDKVSIKFDRLCWDEKIVTIIVKLMISDEDDNDQDCVVDSQGKPVSKLKCANEIPHITIGRLDDEIKAVYSNTLCMKVAEEEGGRDASIQILEFGDNLKPFLANVVIHL